MGVTKRVPKAAGEPAEDAYLRAGAEVGNLGAGFAQLLLPEIDVTLLALGEALEDLLKVGVVFGFRQQEIEPSPVDFFLEVVAVTPDVGVGEGRGGLGGHGLSVGGGGGEGRDGRMGTSSMAFTQAAGRPCSRAPSRRRAR